MHPTLHKRTRRAQAWAITLADSITKRITDGEQIPFLLPIQLPEGQNRRVMQETMKARKERAAERGPEWSWALRPLLDTIPPEPDQLPVSSSDKDENLLSSIYGI